MPARHIFTKEEREMFVQARKQNHNKNVERRLRALQLYAEGGTLEEISKATEYHPAYISQLIQRYDKGGLEAVTGNHYKGNRRNMSFEEEEALLEPFFERAEKGQLVSVSEIETAYRETVGHSIGTGQIYYVLQRHEWRKVMPRGRHPKKADEETIGDSKKTERETA